jgi:hypothetical protein
MPTLIDCFSGSGMASNTASRRPVSTSRVMMMPSITTMPMAAAHDICPASEKATTPFSPSPAASAIG